MYYESFPLSFDEGLRFLLGGGVANTPYTIYSLVIILAVNGLDTVFYGVNLVQIHLFGLTLTLRTQTTQIKCFEPLYKYDRFWYL